MKSNSILLATGIFFLTLLLAPKPSFAQASCSLDELYEVCGVDGFACISPTPSPVAQNPWIKVKASSFSANSDSSLNGFSIPTAPGLREEFNAADPDDDNTGNFLEGDTGTEVTIRSGVVSAPDIGTGIEGGVNANNWVLDGYERKKDFNPAKFLDYAAARKRIKRIDLDGTGTLADMEPERVNIIKGGSTSSITTFCDTSNPLDAANLIITDPAKRGPYVLVVEGDLTINRDINYKKDTLTTEMSCLTNAAYDPVPLTLVVTGTLTINSSSATDPVNQINAVVMAQNVIINPTARDGGDDKGLKIKGNLIVQDQFENTRYRENSKRPAIFIVQDPGMYISLLPYFSTAEYEWKQLK